MSILKDIFNWISGTLNKVKEALFTGNAIANNIKKVVDSPLLDVVTNLTATNIDNQALAYIRAGLTSLIQGLGWADKKVSDFKDNEMPHVMNTINAEASKLAADFKGVELSRQQAIASAQIIYDENIIK